MKRRRFLTLLAAALLSAVLCTQTASACTVFASAKGETVMAGNNEDWFEKDTLIWFVPAEDGALGYAAYGFENAHPQGGMNEKGLFFDWFAQGGDVSPVMADKLVYDGDLSMYMLSACETVEDVLSLYERYNDVNLGYATLLAVDSTGDMATLTWDWANGKPRIERQTNAQMAIGVGVPAIAGMLAQKDWADGEGFAVMAQMASNENTLYSTVCNLATKEIALYNLHDYKSKIDFELTGELQKGKHLYSIPALFPAQARSAQNEITPSKLRTKAQNIGCAALVILIGLFALYCLSELLLRKKREFILLPIVGAAVNLSMLGMAFVVNFWAYFIANYGIEMLGFGAVLLCWAAAALTVAQTVLVVIAWIKKKGAMPLRVVLTVSSVLLLAILCYLCLLIIF